MTYRRNPEDDIENGPDEDSILTTDHRVFFQYGKRILWLPDGLDSIEMWRELEAHMKATNVYPSVWFISDHGNEHLMLPPPRSLRRAFRPRENPGAPPGGDTEQVEAAAAVYSMWHKKEPDKAFNIELDCEEDDPMVCVGNANNIVYRSGKWEKGNKKNDYVHHFDSKPAVFVLKSSLQAMAEDNGVGFLADDGVDCTVADLLADGDWSAAELATPLSLGLDDDTADGEDMPISKGARVLGSTDCRTVIIIDPVLKLVVIRGGEMYFDERGIVK